MAACALPEGMDANGDGILMVNEMIEFDKKMMSAPKKQYAATSPYVEGGETGMDFIKLFDADHDGKVTHEEWEKVRPSTVYRDKHWPEYNKNNDEYITVDEAPQPASASRKIEIRCILEVVLRLALLLWLSIEDVEL